MLRHAIILIVALSVGAEALADGATVSEAVVDRNSPDFIRAAVLECGPGGSFYGCAGHVAIRLTCPYHKLDEVFSHEGEPVRNQVLRSWSLPYGIVLLVWCLWMLFAPHWLTDPALVVLGFAFAIIYLKIHRIEGYLLMEKRI